MKKTTSFPVTEFNAFKIQMLNWVNRFSIFAFLDNQQYAFSTPAFECMLAAGCKQNVSATAGNAFSRLEKFCDENKGEWLFGHFGYDLKNETERLSSDHLNRTGFNDLHFFIPQWVIRLDKNEVSISGDGDAQAVFEEIRSCPSFIHDDARGGIHIRHRLPAPEYLATIELLRQHILRGDCYEINFCQEFFSENTTIAPLQVFGRLCKLSPNPFSVLYRVNSSYCLCASPERYLKKQGNRISSQPIKGTSKRQHSDPGLDESAKNYLLQSSKEKSENVMVVDLVRNDLSKICVPGSVKVDELFGLYSFPQVHQMISTVSGEMLPGMSWIDAVRATFPMGSMTGAPKKRVMELIEQYEKSKRGLFSGAIGYVEPGGNFDFNVVIRSIFYNDSEKYLSFQTGGGITYYSNPQSEYEESLLKAGAMLKVLE
ncbi:MAG TPA: anthranilate synthase component I family protein [Ferruginibacter sp.]|nr:anthranilate synthase component I family protein [Ferruginibacter sp.]